VSAAEQIAHRPGPAPVLGYSSWSLFNGYA